MSTRHATIHTPPRHAWTQEGGYDINGPTTRLTAMATNLPTRPTTTCASGHKCRWFHHPHVDNHHAPPLPSVTHATSYHL
ncbi:hypothetical protein SCLCIDRAFT_1225470 [Scleroderma citrinum Foug A]|uniref:Uncharacterized protein n=1 Tax=Scleroderma citrinum Foug A TaxID=1036808 RepID=A0A0C3CNK9_9AGAM|nr:hypothetical protein SCLCIDRAFT_1225470 [Scleroderma citrinum Foug A]